MRFYDPHDVHDLFSEHDWQRPGMCDPQGGECVEVNLGDHDLVGLRDTKIPGSPVLVFTDEEWARFLEAARAGQFSR
ncbi:DUF397 domain-containing protein [Amycolatopsis samaneae]|uniref:DUF397 domain-containing protein n=1 Tax=Amycolatopsis samaneae TaxID=664691 RepID=A0ABW5G6V8_9PSEU